jgi:hypothetical protein
MFETGIEKVHRGRGSVTSCSSLPPTRVFTTVGIYKVYTNYNSLLPCGESTNAQCRYCKGEARRGGGGVYIVLGEKYKLVVYSRKKRKAC